MVLAVSADVPTPPHLSRNPYISRGRGQDGLGYHSLRGHWSYSVTEIEESHHDRLHMPRLRTHVSG